MSTHELVCLSAACERTHKLAQSNPSVSESRLSEMKVQSPGTKLLPSKNVPFSQTEETCKGGVCFTAGPQGPGLSSPCPPLNRTTLQGWNSNLKPGCYSPPTPLPLAGPPKGRRKGKGQPWSHPCISGGAKAFEHTPPPSPRHHIFTFGCFLFPFFPCQENQALAHTADLPPTLN